MNVPLHALVASYCVTTPGEIPRADDVRKQTQSTRSQRVDNRFRFQTYQILFRVRLCYLIDGINGGTESTHILLFSSDTLSPTALCLVQIRTLAFEVSAPTVLDAVEVY